MAIQGVPPVRPEGPSGLSVPHRAGKARKGCLFDLLCLWCCQDGRGMYTEREGAILSAVEMELHLYQSPDSALAPQWSFPDL